ncbi:MAG: Eco57I restriction-modification methylase domain-containing protein, partial [Thermoflexibacteraceae bacterium]
MQKDKFCVMNKATALRTIKELIAKFEADLPYYQNAKEDVLRIDLINPFFEALGWDIENKKGALPTEREVFYEDTVLVQQRKKAPDYGFTKQGQHRFYVEAKKAGLVLPQEDRAALQLRSYGWSKSLEVSILTNFEYFMVYDCTIEPQYIDVANVGLVKSIHYKNYEKQIDYLWDNFAKENIYNGNFDKIFNNKAKRGDMAVDRAFLRTLELQRDYLAKGILTRNPKVEEEDLNFLVQIIIDRIIFLRICEDRGVEPNDQLKEAIRTGNYYNNLVQIFKTASAKYNSSLFDFNKDMVSPSIVLDNKVVENVISDLYFPKSPYQFAVIGTEILGTAYERFLGKVINITPANSVTIDEKPEVRKAGGVYYTPQYIVDEIVRQTIGKQIAGKTPKEIEQLSILDPSCGSGSFLLGAYQFLLDWYLNYYYQQRLANPTDRNLEKVLTPNNQLRTEEKKRILVQHLYGVDIDMQAVEVTKLSLALKAMEGETEATINTQLRIFKSKVLPNLDTNVVCGNSLVSPDFYEKGIFLTPKEQRKVNVFDWKDEFKAIMKKGGFDIVIGNPPYVFTRDVSFGTALKEYYGTHYLSILSKSANTREN